MAKVAGFKKAADNPVKVRDRGPYRTPPAEVPDGKRLDIEPLRAALKEYLYDSWVDVEVTRNTMVGEWYIEIYGYVDNWEVCMSRRFADSELEAARFNRGDFFAKLAKGLEVFRRRATLRMHSYPGAQCAAPKGPAANPCLSDSSVSGDKHDAEDKS